MSGKTQPKLENNYMPTADHTQQNSENPHLLAITKTIG